MIGNVSDKRTVSLFETEEFESMVSTSIPHMPSDNKHIMTVMKYMMKQNGFFYFTQLGVLLQLRKVKHGT